MAKEDTTVETTKEAEVVTAQTPQVDGEVQTNTASRQAFVDDYYTKGLDVGKIMTKYNCKASDIYGALRDALPADQLEAKDDLQRTIDYFITRGE